MTFAPPDGGRAGDMSARDIAALHLIAHHALSFQPSGPWQRVRNFFGLNYEGTFRSPAMVASSAFDYADAFVAEKKRRDG